jgi:hypothetical protein
MRTPDPIVGQSRPRIIEVVHHDPMEPTRYTSDDDTEIVLSEPLSIRIKDVWWLLDCGFFVRSDLFSREGPYLDERTSEAANRYYMWRHLSRVNSVERIAEIVTVDQHRRTAITESGNQYPCDLTLECLLSLAGEGSVAHAVPTECGHHAYRVEDSIGNLAAISPWTDNWQDWYQNGR